jgi:DNA-binding transcriptional LysR family regulator
VLAAYAAAYPQVDLVLRTGTTAELVTQVLERGLEGALVSAPIDHPELLQETVFREELVVATAPSRHGLERLLRERDLKIVVMRAGCSYRHRLEAILAARGVAIARQLEFGTIEGILGCVAAGLGITLLPRGVLATAAEQGRVALHPLGAGEGWVDTLFIRRRDGYVSSALAAFLACARPGQAAAAE